MQPVRVPRTLPVVLSRDEVARLIAAARNLRAQTALSVAYGTGLRASEVVALKVTVDIVPDEVHRPRLLGEISNVPVLYPKPEDSNGGRAALHGIERWFYMLRHSPA